MNTKIRCSNQDVVMDTRRCGLNTQTLFSYLGTEYGRHVYILGEGVVCLFAYVHTHNIMAPVAGITCGI